MTRRPYRRLLTGGLAIAGTLALVPTATAGSWASHPLPAPPGGQFSTPVGYVGDISFWAPNRGLMTVAGNNSVRGGLYRWDGERWSQLSTVCGGGVNARIAWAGPTEFWTITAPSVGTYATSGLGLCHFRDGAVVGSYSYFNLPAFGVGLPLNAAACRAANDCLFGGVGGTSADGSASGAFHLRWDGASLHPVWNGQGRGVSDLIGFRGTLLESSFVGPRAGAQGVRAGLRSAESPARLLRSVSGSTFVADPIVPSASDVPTDGLELRAMDTDGTTAWAVGGGAGSGPQAASGTVAAPPIALRHDGSRWSQVALRGALPTDSWFGPVAAIPGTQAAWASMTQFETTDALGNPAGERAAARIARIDADGTTTVETLDDGEERGAVTAVACATANDCWAATAKGLLYRWSSPGTSYPVDGAPAFSGTISIRPNEAASQVIPDDPPADDSRMFAPPVELPDGSAEEPSCEAPPALVTRVRVRTPKARKTTRPLTVREARRARVAPVRMTVDFRLARRARVGLDARRGKKVVARAKARTLRAGKRRLVLNVKRSAWPKRFAFRLTELERPSCEAGVDGDDGVVGTKDAR